MPCLISIDPQVKPLAEQLAIEQGLVKATRQDNQARAHLWRAENTLVVTKPESRLPNFAAAQAELAQSGWPVVVRGTGGAAVPQSPDTLNLSLIYKAKNEVYSVDTSYQLLCQPIIAALSTMGITARATAVKGSFCDGKYNLAVDQGRKIKKIVGTSQKWTADKIVLAHAVILCSIDTDAATDRVNTFYALAGSTERKQADVVTSVQSYLAYLAKLKGQEHHYQATKLKQQLINEIAAACESLTIPPNE